MDREEFEELIHTGLLNQGDYEIDYPESGAIKTTFFLEGDESYVLQIPDHRPYMRVNNQIKLDNVVSNVSSVPIPELLLYGHEPVPFTLFERIDGEKLSNTIPTGSMAQDAEILNQVAHNLQNLHAGLEYHKSGYVGVRDGRMAVVNNSEDWMGCLFNWTDRMIDDLENIGTVDDRLTDKVRGARNMSLIDVPEEGSWNLLHGDVKPANVVYDGQTQFIDWDDAMMGDPVFEIAVAHQRFESDLDVPAEVVESELVDEYFGDEIEQKYSGKYNFYRLVAAIEAYNGQLQYEERFSVELEGTGIYRKALKESVSRLS